MSLALLVAALDLAIWLYLWLGYGRFWSTDTLDQINIASPVSWPDICVIVPARNEADMLEGTLPGLLASDYPGSLRVMLVDDRSEDDTAATATRIAENMNASGRLTVISGRPLAGWSGKVRAMQCGLDHIGITGSTPHYVLFTDADIAYDKGTLTQLVSHAEAGGFVLTSLMVRLRCKSLAERWLIPAFVYFFQLLYPFSRVNDANHKTAGAAGGCMLVRYDALMQAGGMEPIRSALIDDCALGKLMKKQGRIWLGLTQLVHSLRPYPEISDIRAMVSRSAYDQLDYSPINLTGALFGMLLIYLAPVLLTLFGTGTSQRLGLASWVVMSITFLPMLRFYRRSLVFALLLPVIASIYMGFTLDSAIQYWRGKGGMWKGRVQATGAKI